MGVKSTQYITRAAAEEKFVDLMIELDQYRQVLVAFAKTMTDEALENACEIGNDCVNGGEGFANYIIGEDRG